jgi:hypothetical protein
MSREANKRNALRLRIGSSVVPTSGELQLFTASQLHFTFPPSPATLLSSLLWASSSMNALSCDVLGPWNRLL